MFRTHSLETLLVKFSPYLLDPAQAETDYEHIMSARYGKSCSPLLYHETVLLLGVRSGLALLLIRSINPNAIIHVVEHDKQKVEKLIKLALSGVHVFSSFSSYLAAIKPQRYDAVLVASNHFTLETLKQLYVKHTIVSIGGEMNETECSVLTLYRLSRQHCDIFFFRAKDRTHPVTGHRKVVNQPEVSVVVAAYGVEDYIDECIASLTNQTLESIEILIVDDGSVDGTSKKADTWAERYPDKVRVIHKENGGCASARQTGLMEAKGEFIAFVDGDDWVESPMYEALFESAVLHRSDIAQCGFYQFYGDQTKKYHGDAFAADGQNGTSGLVANSNAYLPVKPSIWRRIHRASFLRKFQIAFPVHIRRFDDLPFGFITLARAQRLSVIPDCYYAYRLNRPGQDVAITDERLFVHFEIFDWLYSQVRPWASMEIMVQMKEAEISSHCWAHSKLEEHLKADYLAKASEGIRKRYSKYLTNDDWVKKLTDAQQNRDN